MTLNNSDNSASVTFSLEVWLRLAQDGLQMLHKLIVPNPPKPIQVETVYLTNADTVTTKFVPYGSNSMDVKIEIARIMAFFSEFLEILEGADKINNIAVRAFSVDGEEIMYAISSVATARLAGKGASIEWLQKTIIQDNSVDFRLHAAKRKISQLENSLRLLIVTVLATTEGDDWWVRVIDERIQDRAFKFWNNQSRVTLPEGGELIQYTYLHDLKDIVLQNWNLFETYFIDRVSFQNDMTTVNIIRRDEAHNRPIAQSALNELDTVSSRLLSGIAASYPNVVEAFLLDNWHLKLATIVDDLARAIPTLETSDRYNLSKTIPAFSEMRSSWGEAFERARTVVIPPGKESLHKYFLSAMEGGLLGLNQIWNALQERDLSAIEDGFSTYQEAMTDLKEFQRMCLLSEKGRQ